MLEIYNNVRMTKQEYFDRAVIHSNWAIAG